MGLEEPLMGRKSVGTSVAGGVFVLANTILGAGMLGLPAAFAACGYMVGIFMLIVFGTCSSTALILLAECGDKIGRPATFFAVADKAMPGFAVLFDFAIAIKCFGVATSYLIVVGDSIPLAMSMLGFDGILLQRRLWSLIALLLAAPLCYMKNITALRHTSLAALTCVMAITLMILLFALHLAIFDPCPPLADGSQPICAGPTELFTDGHRTLGALPVFVFSYTCHQNAISITNELVNPSRWQSIKVCVFSILTALAVYLVLADSGYSTFGSKVMANVLSNYPTGSSTVAVARIMISLVVTCCYPLQAHPTRTCITTIVKTLSPFEVSEGMVHPIITTAFVAGTAAIALTISDLGIVLKIVGATGSTIVSYILPGACYFALFPERRSRWVGFLLLCMGLVIMPVSLYLVFSGGGSH